MNQETPTSRCHAPATLRNRKPLLQVLQKILPSQGLVLEIASGSGEHAVFFAEKLKNLTWQPSDLEPSALESIRAWIEYTGVQNVRPPLSIDATQKLWPIKRADAVININMIHISPWKTCLGLMKNAARILPENGILFLYGPFKIDGKHISQSNISFDQSLQQRDPSWGVRDLTEVKNVAKNEGFRFVEKIEMPANNFSIIFHRNSP